MIRYRRVVPKVCDVEVERDKPANGCVGNGPVDRLGWKKVSLGERIGLCKAEEMSSVGRTET